MGSDPEIWRLVEVAADLTLAELHEVLQIAVGWQQIHLHAFTSPEGRRWLDENSLEEGLDGEDERFVTLGDVLTQESGPLAYEYDFGDSWEHTIELIEVIPDDSDHIRAHLVRGERRAPLEDSGGIRGYTQLLDTLADPRAKGYAEARAWAGDTPGPWREDAFDPELVDVDQIRRSLRRRFDPSGIELGWGPSLSRLVPQMFPGAQVDFGAYLDRVRLDRPVLLDAGYAAVAVRPYAWLLDRVGAGGLRLTGAGRLPPVVVREAAETFGWDEPWIGTANREDYLPPAADLRETATRLGLVRKQKGRLVPTVAARKLREDPVGLLRHLAQRWLQMKRSGPAQDAAVLLAAELAAGAHAGEEEQAEAIAYGLTVLGWVDRGNPFALGVTSVAPLIREDERLLQLLSLIPDRLFEQDALPPAAARDFARLALQKG